MPRPTPAASPRAAPSLALSFCRSLGESAGKVLEETMDPRAEEVTHFWLDEVGEDGWYAATTPATPVFASDGSRSGRRRGPAVCAAGAARRAARWRSLSSTSFRATCSAAIPAPSPRTPRAPLRQGRRARGFDKRVDARAPVLLPAAHPLGTAVRPGPRGAADAGELRPRQRVAPPRHRPPRDHPALRPVSVPQRRARTPEPARGSGIPRRGRLQRGAGEDPA